MTDRLPPPTFHRPVRAGGALRSSPPILVLLLLASLPAAAQTPATQRSFSVWGFDRVRIDGPYQVNLRTNVAPYARATGTPIALDGVSIRVEGRTLVVRAGHGGWGGYPGEGRGPVTIEVGTHDLNDPLDPLTVDGGFDVVVTGFAVHHVADDRKRALYAEAAALLAPGGLFANVEVVQSATPALHAAFLTAIGRDADDPEDRLAPVEPQLAWLRDAGLVDVDCLWRWRGMALLAGWAPAA